MESMVENNAATSTRDLLFMIGTNMKMLLQNFFALIIAAAIPALATAGSDAPTNPAPATKTELSTTAEQPQSDGEIKKIDKQAGKITVKHGPLANLDMPSMTMVFRVMDSGMLEQVKAGDKVKFTVKKLNGILTITALKTAT